MDRQYPPSIPPLGAYYPGGYPPMMPSEALQPRLHQLQTLSMERLGTYSDYDDPNRAMLPPQNPQRSRRRQPQGSEHVKHRRTRSGCYTCRQRRVKCDETHPVCDRCRKGKRECAYPGMASSSTSSSTAKASMSGSKIRGSPGGSSGSMSDDDIEEKVPLSAIPDDDEDEDVYDEPQSATSQSHKPSKSTSTSPPGEGMTSHATARPAAVRTSSRHSIKPDLSHSGRWASLPKDVKLYIRYHRENMSHHHYAIKYDGGDFLKTTFLEIALNDTSEALLYSIIAFAAYHRSVAQNDDNISTFLSYYNRSIACLQQSLKGKRHTVATLLTILQLATIEEFLGDWVNLLGHQKAAYQILTDLFTPATIMQDETRRKIINWYIRFDLVASIMSGGVPALERQWFVAAADFYKRQTKDRPTDLGAQFETYFATSRLIATDVALLFAAKRSNDITDERFSEGIKRLSQEFAEFGHTLETAFTDTSCFVKSFPRAPIAGDNDLFNYKDPDFLYGGELSTMNFVLTDHWAIKLMFKYQVALATGQTPSAELTDIAMKKCKMFEAIQYGEESGATAVLGCQASLGIMSLFLPKERPYIDWSRRKFAEIERLGYVYPTTLRTRMRDHWGEDLSNWWLPNNEGYPSTIRTIREFVAYRATKPTDAWTSSLREMSGIFHTLNIEEQGFSDEITSAGTDGSISPWPLEHNRERPWT